MGKQQLPYILRNTNIGKQVENLSGDVISKLPAVGAKLIDREIPKKELEKNQAPLAREVKHAFNREGQPYRHVIQPIMQKLKSEIADKGVDKLAEKQRKKEGKPKEVKKMLPMPSKLELAKTFFKLTKHPAIEDAIKKDHIKKVIDYIKNAD